MFPQTVFSCRGSDGLVRRFPVSLPDLTVPVPPRDSAVRCPRAAGGGGDLLIPAEEGRLIPETESRLIPE